MKNKELVLLETLLKQTEPLTRDELCDLCDKAGGFSFPKNSFFTALDHIKEQTGARVIRTNFGKNVHKYKIEDVTFADYEHNRLVGMTISNILQAEFLQEYRVLGNKIQPLSIPRGNEYLRQIGSALRVNHKLQVEYEKFGSESYTAVLHPYCLKAFEGRWYLFAYKEKTEYAGAHVQCFALDRILSLSVLDETFTPDQAVNPKEYFRDAYGIWVDPEHYPVQDVEIACTQKVANYLRTLPLHHTQKEIECDDDQCHFTFHISPTPDFLNELRKWGDDLRITSNIIINK